MSETRKSDLILLPVGVTIFSAQAVIVGLKLEHTGRGGLLALCLLICWLLLVWMIFRAKIGKRTWLRITLFFVASLPTILFAADNFTASIQNETSIEKKLDRIFQDGSVYHLEKFLKETEPSQDELQDLLRRAVKSGDPTLADLLVDAGARIQDDDLLNAENVSPDPIPMVKYLVDQGVDNFSYANIYGETALHIAAIKTPELVRVLLDAGADPLIRDVDGRTPLHNVGRLRSQNPKDEEEIITMFLNAGVDPNIPDYRGYPPGNTVSPTALKVLLANGGRKVELDENGQTSLHRAVFNKNREDLLRIIDEGFPTIDIEDSQNETALIYAVKADDTEMTSVLADAGADVNYRRDPDTVSPLLQVIMNSGSLDAARILVEHGADINAPKDSQDPLTIAVDRQYEEMVRFLLDKGAIINETTAQLIPYIDNGVARDLLLNRLLQCNATEWKKPIFDTLLNDDVEVLTILIDIGADLEATLNDGWGNYNPALFAAVYSSNPDIFTILIENNVAFDKRYMLGEKNALDFAVENDNIAAFNASWPLIIGTSFERSEHWELDMYLHKAVSSSSPNIARKLLDVGANILSLSQSKKPVLNHIPAVVERRGEELTEVDSRRILKELVELLVAAGADPTITDDRGRTAVEAYDEDSFIRELIIAKTES